MNQNNGIIQKCLLLINLKKIDIDSLMHLYVCHYFLGEGGRSHERSTNIVSEKMSVFTDDPKSKFTKINVTKFYTVIVDCTAKQRPVSRHAQGGIIAQQ